jgi:hypothetical protein
VPKPDDAESPLLRLLRRLLLVVAGLGCVLFAGLITVSLVEPIWIERAAREVLRLEVERRVGERIDKLSDARVVQLAQKALGRTDAEIAVRQKALRAEVPQRVANAMADLLKADCECRKRMVEGAVKHEEGVLGSLEQAREQLSRRIESAYGEVSRQLLRELRIFAAANALAFALLALITLKRSATTLQLLMPALAVMAAAALTAAVYLFSQNWLQTIIFGSYVGWAYLAWYGLALAWLADLLCNRARVTVVLLRGLSSVGVGPGC